MPSIKRIFVQLLAAALFFACAQAMGTSEKSDFRLESVTGDTVSLGQFAGKKPVLLVFWATWCPYCNAAVPAINDIHRRLGDRVQVLALNFKESRGKVANFVKEKNVAYQVLLDGGGDVARKYRVAGIPTFVLVDKQGKIVYFDNVLPQDLEKRI